MSILQRSGFLLVLILVAGFYAPVPAKSQVLTTLHSFAPSDGSYPTVLTHGANNDFYGTTRYGGQGGAGTVFHLTPNDSSLTTWSLVVVHTFSPLSGTGPYQVNADGADSVTAPILANDGNFYGTAHEGGANGTGTVYRITQAGGFTKLYDFTALDSKGRNPDGAGSDSNLVEATHGSGTYYGSTEYGGTYGFGTLFQFNPSTSTITPLYSFTGGADGASPFGSLLPASDGNLYGTAYNGGTGYGTVFQFNPQTSKVVPFYTFHGLSDGSQPHKGVIQDSLGNFYGTTFSGGKNNTGVVFQLTLKGNLTILHTFTPDSTGHNSDGANPLGGLFLDQNNVLWGTTSSGGETGAGTLYSITRDGTHTVFVKTPLDPPAGIQTGANPHSTPIQDAQGNFYITTTAGGANEAGTIYRFASLASPGEVIHSFGTPDDGANPQAALVEGNDGSFYGTALNGGANSNGAIFKIGSLASGTPESVLYSFSPLASGTNTDGAFPLGALIQGSDGTLYGTASSGGTGGVGTLFSLNSSGSLTPLYAFTGTSGDGATPAAGLIADSQRNLFGTTQRGGVYGTGPRGFGTCFKIPSGGSLSYLTSFAGVDGAEPTASLVQDADGNSYGTCSTGRNGTGTIFKITKSGKHSTLYSFSSLASGTNADGAEPVAALTLGTDYTGQQALYGTCSTGGVNGNGTIFKITFSGKYSTLHSFSPLASGTNADGDAPQATLIQGKDGNFYGTTELGGAYGYGTLFQLTPDGHLTTLHSFSSEGEGAQPYAPLIQGTDGFLYGTTWSGGPADLGTVFCLDPQTPSLNALHPSSTDAGSQEFTLKVDGAGYLPTSLVYWNGASLKTTYVSGAQLNAAVPTGLLTQRGKVAVTVINSAIGLSNATGSSNVKYFTIR